MAIALYQFLDVDNNANEELLLYEEEIISGPDYRYKSSYAIFKPTFGSPRTQRLNRELTAPSFNLRFHAEYSGSPFDKIDRIFQLIREGKRLDVFFNNGNSKLGTFVIQELQTTYTKYLQGALLVTEARMNLLEA